MNPQITSVIYASGGTTPTFNVEWDNYNAAAIIQVNTNDGVAPGNNTGMPSYSNNGWNASPLKGNWVATQGLKDNIPYKLQVLPTYGGDGSNCVPIFFYKIKSFSSSFDGTNLTVSWTPPEGANQPSQTEIHVSNSLGHQDHTTNNANQCTFKVDNNLIPGETWTVKLQPRGEYNSGKTISQGPWSSKEPVTTIPSTTISSVTYNQGGTQPTFTVDWSQNGSYKSVLQVIDDQGNVVDGATTLPTDWSQFANLTGTWAASAPLTEDVAYQMQVLQVGDDGCVSNAVPILYNRDRYIWSYFDGTDLKVSWSSPMGANQPTQTKVHLHNSLGGQYQTTNNTNHCAFAVKSDPTSGELWTVKLQPEWSDQTGIVSDPLALGPWSGKIPVTPMQEVGSTGPDVIALQVGSVTANQLTAAVSTPVPQRQDVSYIAVATWQGTKVSVSAPVNPGDPKHGLYTFAVTLPGLFDSSRMYTLCLAAGDQADDEVEGTGVGMDLILQKPHQAEIMVEANGADLDVTVAVVPPAGPVNPTGVWTGLYDPKGNLISGAEAGGAGFAHTITLKEPTSGLAYTASAALLRGSDTGPVGPVRWPIITSAPSVDKVVVGDGSLTATWTSIPDPAVTGYLLVASCGGAELARAVFPDLQGCLPLPLGQTWKQANTIQVLVRGVGLRTTGPASAGVTAITAVPLGLSVSYVNTTCTLSWQLPAGMEDKHHELKVFRGETVVHHSSGGGTETTFAPNDAGGYRFTVRLHDDKTHLHGPWSPPLSFLTGAPADLKVHYDGRTLTTGFTPVPGATGYRLSLMNGQTQQGEAWYTSGPRSSVPLEPADAADNTLVVNAIGPGTSGPASRAPVFNPGWYPQAATGNNAAAQWLNPAVSSDMASHTITLGLPNIFPAKPLGLPISNGPFSLDTAGDDHNPPYTYTLTIAKDGHDHNPPDTYPLTIAKDRSPWTFGSDAIRTDLFSSYQAFLFALETATATAWGVQTVQAAIARAMPQTFAETLLYAYAFTNSGGSVDLLPGLVLRAEHAAYQTLGGHTPDQAFLNGFVPAAVAEYAISRSFQGSSSFTALDSFIGWLTGQGATTVPAPETSEGRQAGAGGLIDSGIQAMRQPFLRLVYPRTFLPDDSNSLGSPRPGENAMILAAPSYSILEEATIAVRHGGSGLPAGVGALYFRGRGTLTPQLRVTLDGAPLAVSLGTTTGDLLAQSAMNPSGVALPLSGLRMQRGIQSALVDLPAVYHTGRSIPVRLDWAPSANPDLTALPLLGGDRLHTLAEGALG